MTMIRDCALFTTRGLLTILCLTASLATAKNVPRYGVLVYSNLCIEDESGHTAGNRITLSRFAEGDSLVYEYAEGALAAPVLGESVKIDARGEQMSFKARPPHQPMETIEGVFSADGKVLSLRGDWCGNPNTTKQLSLVVNFSRPMHACPACPSR